MPVRMAGLLFLVFTAILLAVYWPARSGGPLLDDDILFLKNRTLNDLGLKAVWFDPKASPDFYPLTYTSWWLEKQIAGGWSYPLLHVNNILLHAASAMLLAVLLRQVGLSLPVALLGAGLFALHPVQVESVAWMAQRKNTLSGLFYVLTAVAFMRSITTQGGPATVPPATGKARQRAGRPRRDMRFTQPPGAGTNETPLHPNEVSPRIYRPVMYALALLCFVLAMLSKPVTMTLAASLPLLVWIRHRRISRGDLGLFAPFFILALPMAILTMWVQRTTVGTTGVDFELGALTRTLVAGRVFWFYLWKLAVPADLIFAYPLWTNITMHWWSYAAVVLAIAAVMWAWLLRRRITDGPWLALVHWVATLSPALGFIPIFWQLYYYVADHVQYLAMIGPCVLVAAAIGRFIASTPDTNALTSSHAESTNPTDAAADAASRRKARRVRAMTDPAAGAPARTRSTTIAWTTPPGFVSPASSPLQLRAWPTVLAVAILLACAIRSHWLAREYADGVTLWQATIQRNPEAGVAYRSLAKLLCDRAARAGDPVVQRALYEQALKVCKDGQAHGDDYAGTWLNISMALAGLGDNVAAAEAARTALRMHETASPARHLDKPHLAWFNLGTSLMRLCDIQVKSGAPVDPAMDAEATSSLQRTVEADPLFPEGWYNLANHHMHMRRHDQAIAAYVGALKAAPDYYVAMTNMGIAMEAKGDLDGARSTWEDVVRSDPSGEGGRVAARCLQRHGWPLP